MARPYSKLITMSRVQILQQCGQRVGCENAVEVVLVKIEPIWVLMFMFPCGAQMCFDSQDY
jgi:hypothetical protein